jgi:alpha-beta hydrolase superfamily lysophospholipase
MDASSLLGLSKFLYSEGYSSLVLDMRAHGRSGGEKIAFAYEEPRDINAAVDWIKSRPEYKNVPVALMGLSMGGAAAIRAASGRKDIDAVISISSYASVVEMASDFMKTGGMPDALLKVTMPFIELSYAVKFRVIPSKASPVYDITNIPPRPILIAHGTADTQIDVKHAYELYKASGEKAELWIEEGADHCIFKGDGTGPEDEAYRKKIIAFLDKALKTK